MDRLTPERYLRQLEADAGRLAAVARRVRLDAAIPTCPGWTVRDCVAHTAQVYQHKVACIADASIGGEPEPVLLWLWGRRPDDYFVLGGDPAVLAAFRDRLRIATQ